MSLPVVKSGVLTGGLPFVRLGKGRDGSADAEPHGDGVN